MVLTTADRTLCLAWNYNEPYWLATGGRDRTIRVGFSIGIDIEYFVYLRFGMRKIRIHDRSRYSKFNPSALLLN